MANISGCQESIARTSRLQNVCEYQRWGISLPGIYAPTGIIDTKVQIQKDFHRQICRKNHFNRQRTVWGASCLALQRWLMRGCVDVLQFRCCCLPECCVGYELQMCCGLSRPSTGRTVDVAEICALCCLSTTAFCFSFQLEHWAAVPCCKPWLSPAFTTYSSKSPFLPYLCKCNSTFLIKHRSASLEFVAFRSPLTFCLFQFIEMQESISMCVLFSLYGDKGGKGLDVVCCEFCLSFLLLNLTLTLRRDPWKEVLNPLLALSLMST